MAFQSLDSLNCGQCAEVLNIDAESALRRRLFDIGLIPKTRVCCVGKSPFGDPRAYLIRGAVIALRREDARRVSVAEIEEGDYGADF